MEVNCLNVFLHHLLSQIHVLISKLILNIGIINRSLVFIMQRLQKPRTTGL